MKEILKWIDDSTLEFTDDKGRVWRYYGVEIIDHKYDFSDDGCIIKSEDIVFTTSLKDENEKC